jgi:hypothetical protein
MMRRLVFPLALGVLVSLGRSASAQITQQMTPSTRTAGSQAGPIVSAENGASYGVKFDEDELEAELTDGSIPRIVVHSVRGFGLLTRPRTHFVPELLKSVEIM